MQYCKFSPLIFCLFYGTLNLDLLLFRVFIETIVSAPQRVPLRIHIVACHTCFGR